MLYNPKWDNIYTVENLAKWLSTQPKDKKYSYTDPNNCAAAQYLKAQGVEGYVLGLETLYKLGWHNIVSGDRFNETFGRAARRARLVVRGGWRLCLAEWWGIVPIDRPIFDNAAKLNHSHYVSVTVCGSGY